MYETSKAMVSINPFTGKQIELWPYHSETQVDEIVERARHDAQAWSSVPMAERAQGLRSLADALEQRTEELAQILTAEVGKPISESRAEVAKCVDVCRFYAEKAPNLLRPTAAPTEAAGSHVRYDPLGVIFAVMPWNFPFWQVMRFAAPAVMAGNALIFKHAPNTQGCAQGIVRAVAASALPTGLLQLVRVPVERVEAIVADSRVSAVTVTGSERAGRAVAVAAAKHLKKSVLELGGSDPFIVLADADLRSTVAAAVRARCFNGGQTCCAGKRFVVERAIADEFIAEFVQQMANITIGDPKSDETELGALARPDLIETLHQQVTRSVQLGARVLTGGRATGPRDCTYEPTVLIDVPAESPAATEELFGPVAAVFVAQDREEALHLANNTEFGLAASVWTRDLAAARWFAERLQCGAVFVNRVPGSDPRLPFGGVKNSGYGRELGAAGLRELVNVKAVWIDQ